jgi:hypothetical protein
MATDIVELREEIEDDRMVDTMLMTVLMVMMVAVMVPVTVSAVQNAVTAQGVLAQGLNEPYTVTATPTIQEVTFSRAVQSLSVRNDGASTAYVKVNTINTEPNTIHPGEIFEISYNTHVIERVFYYTRSGETTLRITGAG